VTTTLARDIAEDILSVVTGTLVVLFHHKFNLSGTDQTVIITALTGFLTSKRVTKVVTKAKTDVKALAPTVVAEAQTIDPNVVLQLQNVLGDLQGLLAGKVVS
jgi:hypothetical protein